MNLRAYQNRLVEEMLCKKHAFLTLPPGAGKTAIMLNVIERSGLRALVVAPPRVASLVWKTQAALWTPQLTVGEALGTPKARRAAVESRPTVLVTHYDILDKVFSSVDELDPDGYAILVMDESGFIRHSDTQRFIAIRPRLERFKMRFAMNGTPLESGDILSLWTQAYAVDLGESLGRFHLAFQNKYATVDRYGKFHLKAGVNQAEVVEKIRSLCLTCAKTELTELPNLNEIYLQVSVPAEAQAWMRKTAELLRFCPLTAIQKMQQAASGFVYGATDEWTLAHSFKLEALSDLLKELQGHKTIVVYEHRLIEDFIRRLATTIGRSYAEFRDEPIDKLVERDIIALHPASAGHGIDGLQGHFKYMIWVQPDWSGSKAEQTIKRIHRSGAQEPVTVYWLMSKGTLEETMFSRATDRRQHLKMEDFT